MGCELSTPETVESKRGGNSLPSSGRSQKRRKSNAKESSIFDSMTSNIHENSIDNRNDITPNSQVKRERGIKSGLNNQNTAPNDSFAGAESNEFTSERKKRDTTREAVASPRPARISELSAGTPKNCTAEALLEPSYNASEKANIDRSNQIADNRNSAILANYCISPSLSSTATLNHTTRPRLTAASLGALDASLTSTGKSVSLGMSNHSPPATTSISWHQFSRPNIRPPHEIAMSQLQAQLRSSASDVLGEGKEGAPELALEKLKIQSPLIRGLAMSNNTPHTSSPALGAANDAEGYLAPVPHFQDPAASVTSTSMSPSLLTSSMCSPSSRRLPFAQNTRVMGPRRPITVPTDDELRQVPSFQAALRQAIEYNSTTKEDFTPLTLEGLGLAMPVMDRTSFDGVPLDKNRSTHDGTMDELCF